MSPRYLNTRFVPSARTIFTRSGVVPPEELFRLEERFFKSICLPNGTHKTTAPNRLREVDEAVIRLLPPHAEIRLLDVGISSGITTCELLDRIEESGRRVTGVGLDIRLKAYLRSWLGLDILHDSDARVLQVATPFFAKGRPDPSSRTLKAQLLNALIVLLEQLVARRCVPAAKGAVPIALVTPRIQARRGFEVVERDLSMPMSEWAESYDIIRAANVLNRSYFSSETLRTMARRLASCLRPNGLFVICRTKEDGSNDGTIFRRELRSEVIEPIHRIGRGSEIEALLSDEPQSMRATTHDSRS